MADKPQEYPTPTSMDLNVQKFAKHVNKVGPERAFMDFLYGMFLVADEILKSGSGASYVKPPTGKKAPNAK